MLSRSLVNMFVFGLGIFFLMLRVFVFYAHNGVGVVLG